MNMTKNNIKDNSVSKLPVDDKISGLNILFTNQFVQDALEQFFRSSNYSLVSYQISYVRYKPDTSCIVTYKVVLQHKISNENSTSYFYAKAYTIENYDLAKNKSLGLHLSVRKQDSVSICFDSAKIIFYPFYGDSEIKSLDSILDSRKLRRILYRHDSLLNNNEYRISHKNMKYEILRYKPEKRILLKVTTLRTHIKSGTKEVINYFIKCDVSRKGKSIFELLNTISNDIPNVIVPICYDIEKQFMIYKDAQADDVCSIIESEKFHKINMMAASLISNIHKLSINRDTLKAVNNSEYNLSATIESLKSILPENKKLIDEVEKEFTTISVNKKANNEVLIHGDFSYEQLLFQGNKMKILDFDRFTFGDFHVDIGNYIAHLLYKEIFAIEFDAKLFIIEFIDSYSNNTVFKINHTKLNYCVGFSLLSLSIKPFRLFENKWEKKIQKILKVVLDVLKNKTTYGI